MAYATPRTWVAGDVLTAAQLNQDVRDNVSFLANAAACRVFNNVTQSIANGLWTAQLFNSEVFDTDAMHSTATNTDRITINTAGLYLVQASVSFAANVTNDRLVGIGKNSTTAPTEGWHGTNALGIATHLHYSTIVKCVATDILRCFVYQNSGVALNTFLEDGQPQFSAVWVGIG